MIVLLLLAGHPAAQAEEVTLNAAFDSPSGARGTLVMRAEFVASAVPTPDVPTPPISAVPEPGTLVLVGLGLLGLVLLKNRTWNTDD